WVFSGDLVTEVFFGCLFEIAVIISFVFFFFQAEDGIRDKLVTGVQTCALPIYICQIVVIFHERMNRLAENRRFVNCRPMLELRRSEERRVGKECRSRWAAEE